MLLAYKGRMFGSHPNANITIAVPDLWIDWSTFAFIS